MSEDNKEISNSNNRKEEEDSKQKSIKSIDIGEIEKSKKSEKFGQDLNNITEDIKEERKRVLERITNSNQQKPSSLA